MNRRAFFGQLAALAAGIVCGGAAAARETGAPQDVLRWVKPEIEMFPSSWIHVQFTEVSSWRWAYRSAGDAPPWAQSRDGQPPFVEFDQ